MSDFGFSVVLGRPFPGALLRWFDRLAASYSVGVSWCRPENAHATLVNSTYRAARSVRSEAEALECANDLRGKLLMRLEEVLSGIMPFALHLSAPELSGHSVIVRGEAEPVLAELKARLQGCAEAVSEGQVPAYLTTPECIGIDKFSTGLGVEHLVGTVALTLGSTTAEFQLRGNRADAQPPTVLVRGIRVVFYRDRQLADAVSSRLVPFGSSSAVTRQAMHDFFDALPKGL